LLFEGREIKSFPLGAKGLVAFYQTYALAEAAVTAFAFARLFKKQNTRHKNRIHSLLKERLHGFAQEGIFGKKGRKGIRSIPPAHRCRQRPSWPR
jgi:hypothetical protein